MNVTITIDGTEHELSDEERRALRQACAIEQHRCLKRRNNTKTRHLREQSMRQASFLEQLNQDLHVPLPRIEHPDDLHANKFNPYW